MRRGRDSPVARAGGGGGGGGGGGNSSSGSGERAGGGWERRDGRGPGDGAGRARRGCANKKWLVADRSVEHCCLEVNMKMVNREEYSRKKKYEQDCRGRTLERDLDLRRDTLLVCSLIGVSFTFHYE